MVNLLGAALAVVAACCLAGQALTIRLATREGRTVHVLVVVLIVNAAIFVPLAAVLTDDFGLTPVSLAAFAGAGLVSTMLGRAFFYGGIKRVGAARAEPLKASMPLHATVLAVVILGEAVASLQFVGVVLIVLGVAIVSWEGAAHDAAAAGGVDWTGLAYPLLGAFLFGLEPIFATVGFGEGTPVLVGLAIKTLAAAVVFFGFLAARNDLPSRSDIPASEFRWYVAAGLANSGFLLSYYAGLSVSRVGIVVPIMQTSPLIVAAASTLFLGDLERVSRVLVAGSAVVVIGAALVTVFG